MKKTASEKRQEALNRALNPYSGASNYSAIISGFIAKGIPENDIRPRENVFTVPAWNALGRRVKAGEHGVKICVFLKGEKAEQQPDGTEKIITWSSPRSTTVFHISQTMEAR